MAIVYRMTETAIAPVDDVGRVLQGRTLKRMLVDSVGVN